MLAETPNTSYKMSTNGLNSHEAKNGEKLNDGDDLNNEVIIGNKHYIHSRLRSVLSSGPKEVATAYSGVITGDNLRRMASVNAEARTKLVYSPDHPTYSGADHAPGLRSLTRLSSNRLTSPTLLSPIKADSNGVGHNGLLSPTRLNHRHTIDPIENNSPILEQDSNHQSSKQDTASTRTSGSLETAASTNYKSGGTARITSPSKYHFIRDSFVELEDIRKTKPEKFPNSSPKKQEACSSSRDVTKSNDYIKRAAAVNAQAFVHAIMGYEYMTKNDHHGISKGDTVLGKRPSRQSGNSNQNNSKKKKHSESRTKVPLLSELTAQTVSSTTPYSLPSRADSDQSLRLELLSSSNEDDESPPPDEKSTGVLYHQDTTFNCLGLLYNSDTIHPSTAIYLTTEGRLPSVLIPPIVPQKYREVKVSKNKLIQVKRRSKKGDNGWIAIGHPIKTIKIMSRDGRGNVERKYFIGVKRKNEELYVRDSIVVRSGKKENPYVAKIGSIWQEKDGLILTVFWYYRPEDVELNIVAQFHPNEVMASQHHDDIAVACIDDKCQVFGYTQFCRYRANLERTKACISPRNIVPPLSTQDMERVSFSVPLPNNDYDIMTQKQKSNKLYRPSAKDDDDDDDGDDVYFCYRAFNHITGKVMRQSFN